jgi:transcription initiation factor IIE alpha subunit
MSSDDLRITHYREIRHTLSGKRLEVHDALSRVVSATPTELASIMCWDKTSVRPRLTELVDMQRAAITGERRNNQYVFKAI